MPLQFCILVTQCVFEDDEKSAHVFEVAQEVYGKAKMEYSQHLMADGINALIELIKEGRTIKLNDLMNRLNIHKYDEDRVRAYLRTQNFIHSDL